MRQSRLRFLGGLICGIVVAMITIMVIESLGHRIYGVPPLEVRESSDKLAEYIAGLPAKIRLGMMASVLVAWLLGTAGGSATAIAIVRTRAITLSLLIAGVIMTGAVTMFVTLPHPLWMVITSLIGIPATALTTGLAGRSLLPSDGAVCSEPES